MRFEVEGRSRCLGEVSPDDGLWRGEGVCGEMDLAMDGGIAFGRRMIPSKFLSMVEPSILGLRSCSDCFSALSSAMLGIGRPSRILECSDDSEKVRVGTESRLPPAPRQNSSPVLTPTLALVYVGKFPAPSVPRAKVGVMAGEVGSVARRPCN